MVNNSRLLNLLRSLQNNNQVWVFYFPGASVLQLLLLFLLLHHLLVSLMCLQLVSLMCPQLVFLMCLQLVSLMYLLCLITIYAQRTYPMSMICLRHVSFKFLRRLYLMRLQCLSLMFPQRVPRVRFHEVMVMVMVMSPLQCVSFSLIVCGPCPW